MRTDDLQNNRYYNFGNSSNRAQLILLLKIVDYKRLTWKHLELVTAHDEKLSRCQNLFPFRLFRENDHLFNTMKFKTKNVWITNIKYIIIICISNFTINNRYR